MSQALFGETVIVTGAGGGFGEKMSHALAEKGCHIAVADINYQEAKRVANAIQGENGRAHAYKVDVGNEDDVSAMVSQVISEFGGIDILVNNAGIAGPMGEIETIKVEEWNRVFNVNMLGTFLCCREVLPHMIKYHKGQIVNISSSTARIGFKGGRSLPYTCTKFAIEGFSYLLAQQFEGNGVRVNALCPGLSVTNFQKDTPTEHLRGKRCWMPDHIVGPLLYMLTEMAGTGNSVMASDWHQEQGTADKFSYIKA